MSSILTRTPEDCDKIIETLRDNVRPLQEKYSHDWKLTEDEKRELKLVSQQIAYYQKRKRKLEQTVTAVEVKVDPFESMTPINEKSDLSNIINILCEGIRVCYSEVDFHFHEDQSGNGEANISWKVKRSK